MPWSISGRSASRWRRRLAATSLFVAGLASLMGPAHRAYAATPPMRQPAEPAAEGMPLYLLASLNGNRLPDPLPFTLRDGALWASPATLRSLGFRQVDDGQALIRIDSLSGTRVDYDAGTQFAGITAPLAELDLERTRIRIDEDQTLVISAGRGLLLNYDAYGMYDSHGSTSISAFSELRAFNSAGVFSNTALSRTHRGASASGSGDELRWSGQNMRLDTYWKSAWPDSMVSLTVGDTLTSYLPWTRATRIGGVRVGRDFSLQPYRITTPLPAFFGSAVLPSTVDLYIDGIKRYKGDLPAGPFQLDSMPIVTGRGNAQMVLTDALGRRTEVDIPFYAGSKLLAEGLSDWSLEAGYVRQDYGLSSFSYAREPMYSATGRYGLTRSLTLESHAEATRDLTSAGFGAVGTLGVLGQFSGSYAASRNGSLRGSLYSLGYQWQSRRFNFGVNTIRSEPDFRDVASLHASSRHAEVMESATVGASLDTLGSLNLSYVHTRYPDEADNRYAGLYWSKPLGRRVTVSASYNRNLNDGRDQTVFFGLSIFLEGNLSVNTSVQRSHGETSYRAGANQYAPGNTGWSWSVQGQRSSSYRSGYAQADYRGRYGEYRAGANASRSGNSAFAGAAGSLALMNGRVFAGRRIHDSFAVVSTNGIEGVPVKLQNNPVGETDAGGMLMISPLNSYQKNSISIDPMQLPANVRIDRVDAQVTTQFGSGALVSFDISPAHAATLILHDRDGEALPVGTRVRLNDSPEQAMVGYDGMVYLEGLKARNSVRAGAQESECEVRFEYQDLADTVAQIGPLSCE